MNNDELLRRMGITGTSNSSQGDKKRMHLKTGGPAVECKRYGENGSGRLKPRVEASIGGGIQEFAKKVKGGAEEGFRRAKGMADVVAPRIKRGAEEGFKQVKGMAEAAAPRIKRGAEEGFKQVKGMAEAAAPRIKRGAEEGFAKARKALNFKEGGDVFSNKVKTTKIVEKGSTPTKPTKMIAKGLMASKPTSKA